MENKNKNIVSAEEAALRLGISASQVEELRRRGILHATVSSDKTLSYPVAEIADIQSNYGISLSQEAAKVGIQIQRETVATLSFVRKFVLAAGGGFLCFLILVAVFSVLFSVFPLQTAKWLGLISKTPNDSSFLPNSQAGDGQVLAAHTSSSPVKQPSLLQTALGPVRAVSLGIVRVVSPQAYSQVAKETILDTNDVLTVNDGVITPIVPIKISGSSSLEIANSGLIANLNSEYLQGKKPGTNVGDIAIVGPSPATVATPINTIVRETINTISPAAELPASGLFTSVNGLAIVNNGNNTLAISKGKTLALNNSLTLAGADDTTITFQGSDTYVGRATTDILTNKTLAAGSNTISGLSNANLNGAAGISNANLANSTMTINTAGPLSGGGSMALGSSLTLACSSCLINGGNLLTLMATNGSNSSISQGGSLTLAAGSNISTTNNGSGAITVATSLTPSFTTVNGLTLSAAADGFTAAGGTTSRTLTVTGAAITIGSTIQPTSSGPLTVKSNDGHALTLDTGSAASLLIGNINASDLTIGRSTVTTTINGLAATNNLAIGGGTTILKHLSSTATFDAANFSNCSSLGTVTVSGAVVGDTVVATPTPVAGGIESLQVIWNAYVSSTDTITIRGCATSNNQDATNQTWRVDVWKH